MIGGITVGDDSAVNMAILLSSEASPLLRPGGLIIAEEGSGDNGRGERLSEGDVVGEVELIVLARVRRAPGVGEADNKRVPFDGGTTGTRLPLPTGLGDTGRDESVGVALRGARVVGKLLITVG